MNPGNLSRPESLATRRAALSPDQQALLERRLGGQARTTAREPRIPRRDPTVPAVLSFAQQRLWFLDQLAPGNPFYNVPAALRFSFPLSCAVLERTLNEIVRRHESLRTTFSARDGEPVQIIAPSLAIPLPVTDLRHLPETEREAEAIRLATEAARSPFDLGTGPLLRAGLLRLGEVDYVFLFTLHHIVGDGWSLGVLSRELAEIYGAFAQGRPSPLPELPIQYADFAVWQRDWLQGAVRDGQLAYWREQLSGLPVLQLPTDRPRPAVQTYQGAYHEVALSRRLTGELHELSRREGVTLFMTLLAAFQALLHRYTHQDDIVVGTPIAGRNRAEIEGLIGFFVNSLVIRADCSGDPSFIELLHRVQEVALGAYAHQDLPFETLVEELQPERHLSRNPLFTVTFQLFNAPTAAPANPGSIRSLEIKRGTAIFDIAFSLFETANGLTGGWEYNTDLFEAATIARMAGHYAALLEAIAANPARALSEFPLLDPVERALVVDEWNRTARDYPADALLHRMIEAQVDRTPGAVAVEANDQGIAYDELNRRANRLAHHLRGLGVRPDDLVGVCLERGIDLVVCLLGALKAGGAYLPLDPGYPKDRLDYMIRDARPRVVLTHEACRALVSGTSAPVLSVDRDADAWAAAPDTNLDLAQQATTLAYVIYTSGSTGRPRGAMIHHRALCNHMFWMADAFPLGPEDRVLQRTPCSFDASVWEFWAPLIAGARLVLYPHEPHPDPVNIVQAIRRHGITTLQLVPSLLKVLVAGARPRGLPFTAPRVLRRRGPAGRVAGTVLRPRQRQPPQSLRTDRMRHRQHVSHVPAGHGSDHRAHRSSHRQCPHYVLDRHGQPLPVGVPGELHLGGACVGGVTCTRRNGRPRSSSRIPSATGEDVSTGRVIGCGICRTGTSSSSDG
jgi:non-ribosomal peptide synthetase component F